MMDGRRTLTFSSLYDVMPEVDRLLKGHRTLGNWSLGQICNHLSGTLIKSVDGWQGKGPWIVRKTIGPIILGRMLKRGRMPAGIKLPERFQPRPGLDDRAEVEALRASVNHVIGHRGPWADHPLAGPLSREKWERLHLIHCAHHLSFVLPEPAPVA